MSGGKFTCPMHPQIVQDGPGSCPICGMALEPMDVTAGEDGPSHELVDMRHRLIVSAVVTVPVLLLVMSEMIPGQPVQQFIPARVDAWIQLTLATPVVLWGGWPFFVRGAASVKNRSPRLRSSFRPPGRNDDRSRFCLRGRAALPRAGRDTRPPPPRRLMGGARHGLNGHQMIPWFDRPIHPAWPRR